MLLSSLETIYRTREANSVDENTELSTLPFWQGDSLFWRQSPYFKRNLPIFENNRFSNIKVIVYENDMRKIVCFHLLTFQAQLEMDR